MRSAEGRGQAQLLTADGLTAIIATATIAVPHRRGFESEAKAE